MADVGVVNLNLVHVLAERANGAPLGKAAQAVVGGTRAVLDAGVGRVHIAVAGVALRAATLEARHLGHERGTDGLLKEVFGLGRIFELTEQFDVTVRRDGARFFFHAFFQRGQILTGKDKREAERAGLRRHNRHTLGGIVADLVKDGDEGRGGVGRFVFNRGFCRTFDRVTKGRTHHPLERRGDDFTKVGRFIAGFFQRGNKHDENAALKHHVHHIDVGGLRIEDEAVVVAQRLHGAGELHRQITVLLARHGCIDLTGVRPHRFFIAVVVKYVIDVARKLVQISLHRRADMFGHGRIARKFDNRLECQELADDADGKRNVLRFTLEHKARHKGGDERDRTFFPHRVIAFGIRHQAHQHVGEIGCGARRERVQRVRRHARAHSGVTRHVVHDKQIVVAAKTARHGRQR